MDDKRARFEAQVLPHLDAAYRFARWLCRAPDEVDDIVQEAFLRAYRGFETLRGGDVKAWLLTIVRNCHATAARQRQRRATVPLPEEGEEAMQSALVTTADPESVSAAADEGRALARLIAALPQEQREVVLLRELEDMSYREIATVTEVPIGTVMSRLARARAALRGEWERQLAGGSRAVR
jgi:RNA polymerase sigma-70 factor (ECF subfamily)